MYSKKLTGTLQPKQKTRGRGRGGPLGSAGGSSRNSSSENLSRSHTPKDPNHGHAHKPKVHKSPEILRIESLIGALEDGISDMPAGGGCFCMARQHGISPYTPICPHCGLILCTLHNPAASCPSCQSPILSPNDQNLVLVKLLAEKEEILRKEAIFRQKEELQLQQLQEVAQGGGTFPTLAHKAASGTSPPHERPPPVHEPPSTRKVLSLNARGGGTTLTTYAPKAAGSTTPRSKLPPPKVLSANELAEIERLKPVPRPPTEVASVKDVPADEERPWKDLRGGGLVYIPLEPEPSAAVEASESSKGKKKGKGKKGRPDGPSVPGAAPR